MRAHGDIESVNLGTGERGRRVVGNGESTLEKVKQYAEAMVEAAVEGRKDPWILSSGHCVTNAKEARERATRLLAEIEQELKE